MQYAVLDLGTNVFNLLLFGLDGKSGRIEYMMEKKAPSKIGEGLKDGMLDEDAYSRAEAAISVLDGFISCNGGTEKTVAYGTSAIRDAANGKEFMDRLERRFGYDFRIIPGEREAELIYKGVRLSMPEFPGRVLIMDIGGGSNEFIIADREGLLWKRSFPLGMARMKMRFNPSDVMTEDERFAMRSFMDDNLSDLWDAVAEFSPSVLIGTSGSFDTFRDLLNSGIHGDALSMKFDMEEFASLNERLLRSSRSERMSMAGMSVIRVDYIVPASVFTMLVLERTGIKDVCQSDYSLKEGAMSELVDEYVKNRI